VSKLLKNAEGRPDIIGTENAGFLGRNGSFRGWVSYVLKTLIAGVILYALFHWDIIQVADIKRAIADPVNLFQVGLCVLAMILVTVLRWRMLLCSQGVHIRFLSLFNIYFLSLACAPIFPGGVGGDAMRIAYTVRLTPNQKVAAGVSVFVDRLIAMVGVLFVAFFLILPYFSIALSGSFALLSLIVILSGLFVGCIIFLTLALLSSRRVGFSQWLRSRFKNRLVRIGVAAFDAIAAYRSHPKTIIFAIAMSAANQVFILYAVVVIAWRLGFSGLKTADMGIAVMLTQIANVLPLTPGGIGIGEAAFDQILVILTSPEGAVGYGSIFLTYRALSIIVTLPGIFGIFSR
jgi:glycosyltransferase 2 family protein